MNQIARLESKIRDYVNNANLYKRHFKARRDDWMTLCAAMDLLGDTAQALITHERTRESRSFGLNYLRLYGMLQAVFLQQDSIVEMCRLLTGHKPVVPTDSFWMQIRDLRNLSAGHPLRVRDPSSAKIRRTAISRISLGKNGFQILIWDSTAHQSQFENIDLFSLYSRYKIEAQSHLRALDQHLVDKTINL